MVVDGYVTGTGVVAYVDVVYFGVTLILWVDDTITGLSVTEFISFLSPLRFCLVFFIVLVSFFLFYLLVKHKLSVFNLQNSFSFKINFLIL